MRAVLFLVLIAALGFSGLAGANEPGVMTNQEFHGKNITVFVSLEGNTNHTIEGGVNVEANRSTYYEIGQMDLKWLDSDGNIVWLESNPNAPLFRILLADEGRGDYYQYGILNNTRATQVRIDAWVFDLRNGDWGNVSLTEPAELYH